MHLYERLKTETASDREYLLAAPAIQRALREKQEAIAARPKPPRGGRFQREQAARVKSGAVRPWSTKG